MSNTQRIQRPSSARKQTKRMDQATEEALEAGVQISLDGEVFTVRLDEVTSSVTRELRAACGMSFNKLIDAVTTDPDTDVIGAFIWLARRLRGEQLELDDVVVTYRQLLGDDFEVSLPGGRTENPGDGEGEADPEA